MNEENPFQVSESCSGSAKELIVFAPVYGFEVDGTAILCGPSVTMPPVCVFTGETEELVSRKKATEFPSMKLVVRQRSCLITYFISRTEHARRQRLTACCFVAGLTAFVLFLTGIFTESGLQVPLILSGGLIAATSVVLHHRLSLRLTLVSFRKPGIYRVEGFPISYLNQITKYRQAS